MSAEKFLTKVFNRAADFAPFRWVVRNSGALVWAFYTAADTMLIAGPRHYGEHPTMSQDAAGGLFLAVDQLFLTLDKHPWMRKPLSLVYLAAAAAFGYSGMDHDGRWLQLISAAIIGGKAMGHLKQAFNLWASPEGAEKKPGLLSRLPGLATMKENISGLIERHPAMAKLSAGVAGVKENIKGVARKYPVVTTVSADIVGKTFFAIGAIVGKRPDLIIASRLDMGGTLSSIFTDKTLKEIVKAKDEDIAAAKAGKGGPTSPALP
jgi:hypothetical protein